MKKCKKIERIYRDESNLQFKIFFPKTKSFENILDIVFIIKENDVQPLSEAPIVKLLSQSDILLAEPNIAEVKFNINDYDPIEIGVFYRAALFCKWEGDLDFDENVEHLFDIEFTQNFHNENA